MSEKVLKDIPIFFQGDNFEENREIFLTLRGSGIKTYLGTSDTGKPFIRVDDTEYCGLQKIKKWVEKTKEDP
jgi:hypothetical protein